MGFNKGSFRRGTVNSLGSKGRNASGRFNASVTKAGFKQLASAVQSVAGTTARQVLSDKGSYRMSFDETTAIPTNVPSSGTVVLVGLGDNPADAESQMNELAQQAVDNMERALVDQMRELGL